jgi:hypothetical protein
MMAGDGVGTGSPTRSGAGPGVRRVGSPPDVRFFVTIYDRILLQLQRFVTLRIERALARRPGHRRGLFVHRARIAAIRIGTRPTRPGTRGTAG